MLDEIAGQVRRPLLILLGAVGLVLLVACANVANLFLGRAVAREREMGVRVAIGAERYRLFQLLLVESLLIALIGGALGLIVASWALKAVPAVLTTSLPGLSHVTLDLRVVGFTAGLSDRDRALLRHRADAGRERRTVTDALREGARSAGGRRQYRLQAALVVASVALAFVLLVASGLLIRSFANLMNAESGVRALNVLSLEVTLPHAGYNEAPRVRSFYQMVHRAAARDSRRHRRRRRHRPPDPRRRRAAGVLARWHGSLGGAAAGHRRHVGPRRLFLHFGIPLIRGRNFTRDEQMQNRGRSSSARTSRTASGRARIRSASG